MSSIGSANGRRVDAEAVRDREWGDWGVSPWKGGVSIKELEDQAHKGPGLQFPIFGCPCGFAWI